MILKEKLIEFLKNNENILDIYDLDPLSLKEELISFQTQFPSKICFKEFVSFLKQPRATKISRTDSSSSKESTTKAKPSENICLLREKDILMFEQIYNDLDRHQDLVIPLKELLYKLKNDVHFARILYEPIVYLTKIDKAINLDRVLYQLEREALTEKERRDKEYISWNYLINFITKYQLKPYIIRQNDEKNVQSEEQIISMDQRIIDIMKGNFLIQEYIF